MRSILVLLMAALTLGCEPPPAPNLQPVSSSPASRASQPPPGSSSPGSASATSTSASSAEPDGPPPEQLLRRGPAVPLDPAADALLDRWLLREVELLLSCWRVDLAGHMLEGIAPRSAEGKALAERLRTRLGEVTRLRKAIVSAPIDSPLPLDGLEHFVVTLRDASTRGVVIHIKPRDSAKPCCDQHTGQVYRQPRDLLRGWSQLSPLDRVTIASRAPLQLAEWRTLVWSLLVTGDAELARRALQVAWRSLPGERERIAEQLGELRGERLAAAQLVDTPDGLVTAAEAAARKAGKVFAHGAWRDKAEAERLWAGETRAGERWVARKPAELIAAGLTLLDGRWRTPAEVRQMRAEWPYAWQLSEGRWLLLSNAPREQIDPAMALLRALEPELERQLGAPRDALEQLVIELGAGWSDFQRLARGRLMIVPSALYHPTGVVDIDSGAATGFRRHAGEDLRPRAAHLAASLWFASTLELDDDVPFWLASAIGCSFEGARLDKAGALELPPPKLRLLHAKRMLARQVWRPLSELFGEEDLERRYDREPLNVRRFETQSWAIYHALRFHPDPARRKALSDYVFGGRMLSDSLGDLIAVDRELRELILAMPLPE